MNKKQIKWMALALFMVLAGCQRTEDLASSVNSRWSGITGQDLEKSYEYFSPGYKETENLESFKLRIMTAQINLQWKKGEFISAECEDESVCKVKVLLDYSYKFAKRSLGGMDVQTEVVENWIKLDEKWYFVPENKQ